MSKKTAKPVRVGKIMRTAFASAIALAVSGSASTSPAQQEEQVVTTVLFEQEGEPYQVVLLQSRGMASCYLDMHDFGQGLSVSFVTDGRERTRIEVQITSENPPEPFRKAGLQQSFRIETGGVAQRYTLTTRNTIKTVRIAGTVKTSSVAQVQVPRPALPFLVAGIENPNGMTIRVGNFRPIQFMVPAAAAYMFRGCGFGS